MTKTLKPRLVFECSLCSRCGGTGHYSFNMVSGSTCFGCSGIGWKLSKRGVAANSFYSKLCSVRADEAQVGMKYREEAMTMGGQFFRYWATITLVHRDGDQVVIESNPPKGKLQDYEGFKNYCSPDKLLRIAQTAEEKKAKMAEALAYQETLTQAGTPRKVRAAA